MKIWTPIGKERGVGLPIEAGERILPRDGGSPLLLATEGVLLSQRGRADGYTYARIFKGPTFFGRETLEGGDPYQLKTLTPSEIFVFDPGGIEEALRDPLKKALIMTSLTNDLVRMKGTVVFLQGDSVKERVEGALVFMADKRTRETPPIRQEELAEMTRSSRVKVNKAIQRLEEEGVIERPQSFVYKVKTGEPHMGVDVLANFYYSPNRDFSKKLLTSSSQLSLLIETLQGETPLVRLLGLLEILTREGTSETPKISQTALGEMGHMGRERVNESLRWLRKNRMVLRSEEPPRESAYVLTERGVALAHQAREEGLKIKV